MMEFQDNVPLYIQIASDIKEKIVCGTLKDDEKLASVREYSVLYGVTALTIHRAIQILETEGVVKTKKGVGSFVISGVRQELETKMVNVQVQEFIQRMRNMGIPEGDILRFVQGGFSK